MRAILFLIASSTLLFCKSKIGIKHEEKSFKSEATGVDSSANSFRNFYVNFVQVIKDKNINSFKRYSLDSLECEKRVLSTEEFIKKHFQNLFDAELLLALNDSNRIEFMNFEVDSLDIHKAVKTVVHEIKQVNVIKVNKYPEQIIVLNFIETENGYRFYGYDKFG